jgi:hypothetical protein
MDFEVLEGLKRPGLSDARQHRVHGLPTAVAEKALHVPAQRQDLRAMAEALLEGLEPTLTTATVRLRRRRPPCAHRTERARKVQGSIVI